MQLGPNEDEIEIKNNAWAVWGPWGLRARRARWIRRPWSDE